MSESMNWAIGGSVADYNQGGDWTLPDEDSYTLRLVDKGPDEPVDPKYNKTGKPKYRAKFVFEIEDDPDFEGTKINQYYTISLNEKSNFFPVVKALLGRDLEPTDHIGWEDGVETDAEGNEYDVIGLAGRAMKATIKHDKKEDGRVFPKIDGPVPLRKRGAKKAAPVEVDESAPPF
jgi:hypothetical protein